MKYDTVFPAFADRVVRRPADIGQMGAALAGSRLFVEAGLAAAVVLWTPLSILGFLAGLLSLFPATIWARQ